MAAATTRVAPITVETAADMRWSPHNCGCTLCVGSSLRAARVCRRSGHQPIVDGTHLARFCRPS